MTHQTPEYVAAQYEPDEVLPTRPEPDPPVCSCDPWSSLTGRPNPDPACPAH